MGQGCQLISARELLADVKRLEKDVREQLSMQVPERNVIGKIDIELKKD